jgi:hypothetical protein
MARHGHAGAFKVCSSPKGFCWIASLSVRVANNQAKLKFKLVSANLRELINAQAKACLKLRSKTVGFRRFQRKVVKTTKLKVLSA